MYFASSFPFLETFWMVLIIFAFMIWIWLAITVFGDLFSRRDTSGVVKALWVIAIIIFPYLGVLIYLLVYHDGMAQRGAKRASEAQSQMDSYIRQTAGQVTPADQIAHAKALLDNGTITQSEFEALKAKALS